MLQQTRHTTSNLFSILVINEIAGTMLPSVYEMMEALEGIYDDQIIVIMNI